MRDRIALMLDSMITAVDEGFSFDGVVSMPERGLEDIGHRPGLAGWFDDGVELFQRTVSKVAARIIRKTHSPTEAASSNDEPSIDSGIGPGQPDPMVTGGSPSSQVPNETEDAPSKDPRRRGSPTGEELRTAEDTLPRDPRRRGTLGGEELETPDKIEGPLPQDPRRREVLPPDDAQGLPGMQSKHGDVLRQNQPLKNMASANQPSNAGPERQPRKPDEEQSGG